MIQYKCTKCGATLESPFSMAGQQDKCPLCGQVCVVPQQKSQLPLILGASGGVVAVIVLAVAVAWLWPTGDEPKEPSQARDAKAGKVVAKAPPTTRPKAPPTTKPKAPPTTKPKSLPTTKPKSLPTTKPKVPPTTKPKSLPTTRPKPPPTTKPKSLPTTGPKAPPTTGPKPDPERRPEKDARPKSDQGILVERGEFARSVIQGTTRLRPRAGKQFLWVKVVVSTLSDAPKTLDLMAVGLEDSAGNRMPLAGFVVGKRKDAAASIDYIIEPTLLASDGPFSASLFTSLTISGPGVGKVQVEIDRTGKKSAKITFHQVPTTLSLAFIVPEKATGFKLKNVFGKTLAIPLAPKAKPKAPPTTGPKPDPERRPEKDARPKSDRRRIALVVQRAHIPDFSEQRTSNAEVVARLDTATEYAPGDDVAAAVMGAKSAGWAAGYEFMPVRALKVGEKPRGAITNLPGKSDVVLLVRVSTRMMKAGGPTLLTVLADAALYRKPGLEPLLKAGFLGAEAMDRKETTGNKVRMEYWMKTTAAVFGKEFDAEVLARMQRVLQRKEIAEGIAKLKQSQNPTPLTPSIKALAGGDKRVPELSIVPGKTGARGVVYLEQKTGKIQRRWFLGRSRQVDVPIKPGQYTIYAQMWSEKDPSQRRVYSGKLKTDYKKRYSYSIP